MSISSVSGVGGISTGGSATSNVTRTGGNQDFASILDKFREEASKTPEEKAKDGVLKRHGLSSAQFDQLPANRKQTISSEISEAVRQVEKQRTGVNLSTLATVASHFVGL